MTTEEREHLLKYARVAAKGGSEQERRKAAERLVRLLEEDGGGSTADRVGGYARATLQFMLGVPASGPGLSRAVGRAAAEALAALQEVDVVVTRRETKGGVSTISVRGRAEDMDALVEMPLALGRAIRRGLE